MKSAVLFDMDGLMFDTERLLYKARDYAGEKLGIGKAGYMTIRIMGRTDEDMKRVFSAKFGKKYDHEKFLSYTWEFLNCFYSENIVPARPGLFELIGFLKSHGIPMAVASSSVLPTIERYTGMNNIYDDFTALISGDMAEHSKPAPDIYLMAAKAVNTSPENCFVLEDSCNGIRSAHAAGCRPIMVHDLCPMEPDVPGITEFYCHSLSEVKSYFEMLGI